MKLALFTNQFPSRVSTFISRDIYSLIQNGVHVDVFPVYPVSPGDWRYVPEKYRSIIQRNVKVIYVSPVGMKRFEHQGPNDATEILRQSRQYGLKQYLKSCYVVKQSIKWAELFDGAYDQILSYWGNYSGTYAYLSNQLSKSSTPFSFFLHAGTDLYRDQIFLEQKILGAEKVFTVCDFNIRYLERTYPLSFDRFREKLILYHLGVDLEELKFVGNAREENCLLAIGSLFPQKGFVHILEAMSLLRAELPHLRLMIIGEGPDKIKLARIAKKLGILDQVAFTGLLPFEEVKEFLWKCTLLIHPSSDLGDAVPTVIKEALACGLPVIGSNIAGIPELLDYGRSGVLVSPKDSAALSLAIRDLLLNEERRTQLARNGRSFAEVQFDMSRNGQKLCTELASTLLNR